jgi:transcriptional regulator GlxA family with amidase domain
MSNKIKATFFIVIVLTSFLSTACFAQKETDTTQNKLPKMTLLNHKRIMSNLFGEPPMEIKTLGILVYDGFSAMEGVGAMVCFSELMNVEVYYIGMKKGMIKSDLMEIQVSKTIDDIKKLDLLLVPGGDEKAVSELMKDSKLINWLKKIDAGSKITAASGNGVFILGKADLLKNKNATCNWFHAKQNLQQFQSNYLNERYVFDGKYWTSSGSTASIDMCLALIKQICGETYLQGAMLDLEYDPMPPLAGGVPDKTNENIIQLFSENYITIDGIDYLTSIDENKLIHSFSLNHKNKVDSIGILVYEGGFTLDFLGPLTVLSQLPKTKVILIGTKKGVMKSGRTTFKVNYSMNDIKQLDILVIPGGSISTWEASQDTAVINWIKKIDQHTRYTISVCTGAWILGEAGLLKNRKATTHWYHKDEMLEKYGAISVDARYTKDGKYWTSAGVSAGIDLSYALIRDLEGDIFAQYALLNLNYDPQSPIPGGSPDKSDPRVVDMMTQMYDYMMLKRLNIVVKNK